MNTYPSIHHLRLRAERCTHRQAMPRRIAQNMIEAYSDSYPDIASCSLLQEPCHEKYQLYLHIIHTNTFVPDYSISLT